MQREKKVEQAVEKLRKESRYSRLRLSKQVVFFVLFFFTSLVSEVQNKERRVFMPGTKKTKTKCKLHKITNERGL